MTKYFVVALITINAFIAGASGNAFARETIPGLEPSAPDNGSGWLGESGTASYYGPAFHGRRSASGGRFDQMALTAAHPWLPFGTKVKVTLSGSARTVIVTITDRIYSGRRILDLSVGAARQLGIIDRGVAAVTLLPV